MSHPACFNCEKNQEECLDCEFFDYREDSFEEDDFDEVDDDPVYSLGDFDDYEDEDEEVFTWGEE
ncbi:MAG: hypothetical protein EOM07_11265 [Clostridia bacterium]|nr:hypothetical protein [Clostridia bacterium]